MGNLIVSNFNDRPIFYEEGEAQFITFDRITVGRIVDGMKSIGSFSYQRLFELTMFSSLFNLDLKKNNENNWSLKISADNPLLSINHNVSVTITKKPEEEIQINDPKRLNTKWKGMLAFHLNTCGFAKSLNLFASINMIPIAGNNISIKINLKKLLCGPKELLRTPHELKWQASAQLLRVIECKPGIVQLNVQSL